MRVALSLVIAISVARAAELKPTVVAGGLEKANSVAVTPDKRIFVATAAGLVEIINGKPVPFAAGVKSPRDVVSFQQSLFAITPDGVVRIDVAKGAAQPWAMLKAFPDAPTGLKHLAVDEKGTLYTAKATVDSAQQTIYRIAMVPRGRNQPPEAKVSIAADAANVAPLTSVAGLMVESLNDLVIGNSLGRGLTRLRLSDRLCEPYVGDAPVMTGSPTTDDFGRLYFTASAGKELWSLPRADAKPVKMLAFDRPIGGLTYDRTGHRLLMTVGDAGELRSVPAQPPGFEVDVSPLPLKTEVVFDKLTFTGYDNGLDAGKEIPLRPIVLTHAGDGSGRTFIATQHGVIHSFRDGDPKTIVALDIQSKCFYKDTENEQGLLGLAFHPKFKDTRELFVFYTDKSKRFENVLSRFRMKKDDPERVDPASEVELLRVTHKYWNHDGGTVAFGPDGMLYLVLGDGGSGNDPDGHGQMRSTLLGKILRIDIDKKDPGLPYAIPKDNPFVNDKGTRPEIYALGVRNPWRLSFDRKTGQGWFAEVGQNLWEEINRLEKGGNYGWSVRESQHPFGPKGTVRTEGFVEPIWEYHHAIGKSITGGFVSRGSRLPEIEGHYIYADYVFAKIWALKYDETQKRVVANRPIADSGAAVLSFGEDEKGELYILTYSATGRGISRIVRN
jgi:glucose/arabinose dehydrogenase